MFRSSVKSGRYYEKQVRGELDYAVKNNYKAKLWKGEDEVEDKFAWVGINFRNFYCVH